MAAIATLLTLLVAYPFALAIARSSPSVAADPHRSRGRAVLDELPDPRLRLDRDPEGRGPAQSVPASSSASSTRRSDIFATNWAVVIGIVYSYLPFMLLPLYAALEGQDPALLEAAADLGAVAVAGFCA